MFYDAAVGWARHAVPTRPGHSVKAGHLSAVVRSPVWLVVIGIVTVVMFPSRSG